MAQEQELFSIGPFGGLDSTTSSDFVADTDAVAMSNVVPYRKYLAYYSAQGRTQKTTSGWVGATAPIVFLFKSADTPTQTHLAVKNSSSNSVLWRVTNLSSGGPVATSLTNTSVGGATFGNANGSYGAVIYNGIIYMVFGNQAYALNSGGGNTFWGIAAPATTPTVAAGGAGTLTGTYYYAVTFTTHASGSAPVAPVAMESSPSTVTAGLTLSSQSASLTAIPVSSDANVSGRNIYRLGGTLGGQWFLVGTINNNTTTTFTDNTADSAVTGQSLVMHRDDLTSSAGSNSSNNGQTGLVWPTIHKERVWLQRSQSYALPYDIAYSNYGEPWGFDFTNQVIKMSGKDAVVATASMGSILVVLKQKTLHAIYGDSQQDFIPRKLADIGCTSTLSVVSGYGGVFWLSDQGVYFFDGSGAKNISDGALQSLRSAQSDFSSAAAFLYQDCYCLSFPNSGITYCYHIPTGKWHSLSFSAGIFCYDVESFPSQTTLSEVFAGSSPTSPTQLDQWFTAETDKGSSIVSSFTTKTTTCGSDGFTKQFTKLIVNAPVQTGVQVSITITVDGSITNTQTVTLNKARNVVTLPPTLVGDEVQLQISATSNNSVEIQKVTLMGYVKRAVNAVGPG